MTEGSLQNQTQRALIEFALAKKAEQEADERAQAAHQAALDALAKAGVTRAEVVFPAGERLKASVVRAERVVTDYDLLRERIDDEGVWNSITKQVVDPALLEAAVAMGVVSKDDVAAVSETRPNKPFIKITGDASKVALEEAALASREVSIRDSSGRVKPAAARKVKKP